jgi:hypothetical protein
MANTRQFATHSQPFPVFANDDPTFNYDFALFAGLHGSTNLATSPSGAQFVIHAQPFPIYVDAVIANRQYVDFAAYLSDLMPSSAGGGGTYVLSGPGVTELFVTRGGLSSGNVSYMINPMSRRTN